MTCADTLYDSDGIPSTLIDGERLKVSSIDSFSAAGATGLAFARTTAVTIPAGSSYSVKLQKSANVAVRFIRAKGLYVTAVSGSINGAIVELDDFISTNGIITPTFSASMEIHNEGTTGSFVLGRDDELMDSFYPDGEFVIGLENTSATSLDTHLSIGLEQISLTGVYIILEPSTQLEPNTEMSTYNGTN